MIAANDITVQYGSKTILNGLDFKAEPGALTAIVGPNGSGKSTLLKALSGEMPCSGKITIAGHDIATTPAWKLANFRAVLPQSTPMSFPLQAIELVRLGLRHGSSIEASRPSRALARVDLSGFDRRFY